MTGEYGITPHRLPATDPVQLALPGMVGVCSQTHRGRVKRNTPAVVPISRLPDAVGDADPLLVLYLRRLAARGVAPQGFTAYRYQLRVLLGSAMRRAGHPLSLVALFGNPKLLGQALVDDRGVANGQQLSRWTLAQRRSAVRSFASLVRPELFALLGEDPHVVLDGALRGAAERVGTGYRLTGGSPRRRGGYAPTVDEVAAVIAAAGRASGFVGLRDAAFFGILAESGARVNALRELNGADCAVMPDGRLRLFLHAKGKEESREVEVSRARADELRQYAGAFNQYAAARGWRARVRLGEPGPLWRNSARGCWSYQAVVTTFHAACAASVTSVFTPHALRRAFASNAAGVLPRHVVARAGGWQGLERLDDHYVQARDARIGAKLRYAGATDGDQTDCEVSDASIVPVPGGVRRATPAPAP